MPFAISVPKRKRTISSNVRYISISKDFHNDQIFFINLVLEDPLNELGESENVNYKEKNEYNHNKIIRVAHRFIDHDN